MDFAIPAQVAEDLERFEAFLQNQMESNLAEWYKHDAIPRDFFEKMGHEGWLGYSQEAGQIAHPMSA